MARPARDQNPQDSLVAPALRGYEYQRDVSLFIGMRLLIDLQSATEMTIEPASGEDMEVEIRDEDAAATLTAVASGRTCILQVKRTGTGPWTLSDFKALLQHGRKRPSAAKQLKDTQKSFLLVTNESLAGVLRGIAVSRPGTWPAKGKLPASLCNVLPAEADGRVGALPALDERKLELELNLLAEAVCCIPRSQRASFLDEARKHVWRLMKQSGTLTRAWLTEAIRRHGGNLASSLQPGTYVRPSCFGTLHKNLASRHGVLIVGSSGTGKTATAEELIRLDRVERLGCEIIYVKSPEDIISRRSSEPLLFYCEDPWGKYEPSPGQEGWTETFRRELPRATPDRKFVITTRSDICPRELLECSGDVLESFVARLEAEDYSVVQKRAIFDQRFDEIADHLRELVRKDFSNIFSSLSTPLEIQKFFDQVARGIPEGESGASFVRDCLSSALNASIEDGLSGAIRSRGLEQAAALVWAIFSEPSDLSRAELDQIGAKLTDFGCDIEGELETLVRQLVSGRHLIQSGGHLKLAHNRVEFGLKKGFQNQNAKSRRVLSTLCRLWLNEGRGARAADVWCAFRRLNNSLADLPSGVHSELDHVLSRSVATAVDEASGEDALKRLANAGSEHGLDARLARFLLEGVPHKDGFWGLTMWQRPEIEGGDLAELAGAPNAASIIEQFLRFALPFSHKHYPVHLGDDLKALHPGIVSIAREAAATLIADPRVRNSDVIARLAVDDFDQVGGLIEASLRDLEQQAPHLDSKTHLALLNEEYDEHYADHLWDSGYEEPMSDELLQAFAEVCVERLETNRLIDHASASALSKYWLKALRDRPGLTSDLCGLAVSCVGSDHEGKFWSQYSAREDLVPNEWILSRLEAPSLSAEALDGLLEAWSSRPDLGTTDLATRCAPQRAMEIAVMLAQADQSQPVNAAALEAWLNAQPAPLAECCRALTTPKPSTLSEPARAMFNDFDASFHSMAKLARLNVLYACGENIGTELLGFVRSLESDICWDNHRYSGEAAGLALSTGQADLVEHFAQSPYSSARRVVLQNRLASGILSADDMMLYVRDTSREVRKALLDFILQGGSEPYREVLLAFCGDRYASFSSYNHGDSATYPDAQRALKALSEGSEALAEDECRALLKIAMDDEMYDRSLRIDLIAEALKSHNPNIASSVLECAMDDTIRLGTRKLCAMLLTAVAEVLPPDCLAAFDYAAARMFSGSLRIWLLHCTAASAPEKTVLGLAQEIAGRPEQSGLLMALLVGASDRADLCTRIISHAQGELKDRLKSLCEEDQLLPKTYAPYFGSRRVHDLLLESYPNMFKKDTAAN